VPTYEYRCETCEKNFDVVQSFHDEPVRSCPTCGSPVRKVFGNVGIVFKGSGFYKNDSRDGKAPAGDAKSGGGSDGGSDGTSSGAESSSTAGEPSKTAKEGNSSGNGSGSGKTATPTGPSSSAKESTAASKADGS
jgi:putative FmdB family regulatory protein